MSLEEIRKKIDLIDEQIVELLNRRAELALKTGNIKKSLGEPVRDLERENQVIEHVSSVNRGVLSSHAIKKIFKIIISVCAELQEKYDSKG